MLKNKILMQITGSIAAYKSAYLISKLKQNGFEVRVAASQSALKFIGKAALEGLSGNAVYTDSFEDGKMMSHINLAKWADLIITVPASANTINKFAAGIADNLITSLFLARDCSKPYLIAPAMNVNMFSHPATQESLAKLEAWGMEILPADEGYLACGDEGKGKLLDPDKIYNYILRALYSGGMKKKILITSGGTKENIDGVRFIANMSTGKTGAALADKFFLLGCEPTVLISSGAAKPEMPLNVKEYAEFEELKNLLIKELSENEYDAVIHLAAVSDYKPAQIIVGGNIFDLPLDNKLKSESDDIQIKFAKNEKIVDSIKERSLNKNVKLVSFKLLEFDESGRAEMEIKKLFDRAKSDAVVFNSLNNRPGNRQTNFEIHTKHGGKYFAVSPEALAEKLNQLFDSEEL